MNAIDLIGKKFEVLGDGYVKLFNAMPIDESMEDYCAEISRLSYDGKQKRDNDTLWRKLCKLGGAHIKSLEFITLDLEIRAPLLCWFHLDTYRLRSYYSQSLRRITVDREDLYLPENATDQQRTILEEIYNLSMIAYHNLLDTGMKRQQARLALCAYGVMYTRRVKWDAKSLLRILKQRTKPDTQDETREVALCILRNIYQPLLPITSEVADLDKFC